MVGAKRQAQEKHLEVGVRVAAKRKRLGAKEPEAGLGTIEAISDEGVLVKWDGPGTNGCIESLHAVSEIELSNKKQPSGSTQGIGATSSPGNLDLEACKWSPCSTATNNEMVGTLTAATLYQAYVGRSSAHEDLHVVFDTGVFTMYALKEMKAGALLMLPFGDLIDPGVASPGSAPVAVELGDKDKTATEFRLRAKSTPKKLGTNEKAVVLVPFWVLAARPPSSVGNLVYKTTTMSMPQPPQVGKPRSKAQHAIVIKTVCITNDEVVRKGAELVVTGKLPTMLV